MSSDALRSADIVRAQALLLLGHVDEVAMRLERQVAALEESAAREKSAPTADRGASARLLAEARARREELDEARSHRTTLRRAVEGTTPLR